MLASCRDLEPFDLEDGAAAPGWLQEVEAEAAPAAREEGHLVTGLRVLLLESADLGQLGLRLLRLRLLVPEPLHEALESLDVLCHPLGGLLRVSGPLGLLAAPGVPRPRKVRRPAGLELEGCVRRRFEKPTVVRDDDARGVEARQLALEPFEARDVEMVRRLVEEQQVGIPGERSAERRTGQLAARERAEASVQIVVVEPEPTKCRARAVAPVVAACMLEPCLGGRVRGHRLLVVGAPGHRPFQARELLLGRDQVGRAREHVVAQRQSALERRALVVERDPRALLEGQLAALDRRLAGEHPEQRRLAGAVRPGERQAVAALELEGDPVEEGVAGELLAEVGCDQNGHPPMVACALAPAGRVEARGREGRK